MKESVKKLTFSSNNVFKLKPEKRSIYFLNDAIVLCRVTREEEDTDLIEIASLFEGTRPKIKSMQKYRQVIPMDFAQIEFLPDQAEIKNILSITYGGKKERTIYFSASSDQIKLQFNSQEI